MWHKIDIACPECKEKTMFKKLGKDKYRCRSCDEIFDIEKGDDENGRILKKGLHERGVQKDV